MNVPTPKVPKAFPENSSLQNVKRFKASPILYMQEAADRWGSPVDLNLPFGRFVLITDPEQAQHVMVHNHQNYQKSKGYKEIARVLGNGILSAEGEQWKRQRQILQPSFHKPELKKLLPSVWNTTEQFIHTLGTKSCLKLDEEMSGLTLTILLNSLIHYDNTALKEKMAENIVFGQEFIVDRIRTMIKWPVWLPTKTNRRYHKMMAESSQLIQSCIDHRRQLDEKIVQDLLAVLLENYDPKSEFEKIRNELLTFLVAGHETSALGITWCLHILGHHSGIQARLFEEVKGFDALEDLDMMNFSNLSYTIKVIKESMRLYPPIWNIVRMAKEEDTIGGYTIQKGQQLMSNILEIHHNEKYWPDAERFDPERFDAANTEELHKFQYMPFGAGPRFCIGNNFAMFEMVILLVQWVRNFEIRSLTPEHIGFNPLLTLRPDRPIEVELRRR